MHIAHAGLGLPGLRTIGRTRRCACVSSPSSCLDDGAAAARACVRACRWVWAQCRRTAGDSVRACARCWRGKANG